MLFSIFTSTLLINGALARPWNASNTGKPALRVETFVNGGTALDMVSSLIIGSEAAAVVDLPLTISSAKDLAAWVRTKTDKPIVSAFTSHNHPDHYLGAQAFLDVFPNATYYANPTVAQGVKNDAAGKAAFWGPIVGASDIVKDPSAPFSYNFTFFTLPGDEHQPIQLLQPLTGDTVDETLFWIPSTRTLIAGDSVYATTIHPYMADMLTPALTSSWIATLELIEAMKPHIIVPGHSVNNESWTGPTNLAYTKEYLKFWQSEIESKGPDYYTPQELFEVLTAEFPGRNGSTSQTLLNITVENFGRGGTRFAHTTDFTVYTDEDVLNGWEI